MEELVIITVAFAVGGTFMAIYTDLKSRIIPNRLTYSMIIAGIALNLINGLLRWDLLKAISGFLGAGISFAIGYGMWLTGGWAGGDVKLFTGYGALLPFYTPPSAISPVYPFPITILFNSVLIMIPILLIYAVFRKAKGLGVLYEETKITELEEGMIPAEIIYEKDGKVYRGKSWLGIKPSGVKIYADPSRAAGLSNRQIAALRRLVREGKLKNHIKLKRGMPYAPALGAGLLAGIFFGDIYLILMMALLT
ncbi:MAG: prepilin peptidase [Candidatus Hadarchaeales archaeon]